MNQYLCISTTFLAGRYHGQEWPPAPARLFQALLAGARTGIYREHWPVAEAALRCLERLPAPEVLASDCRPAPAYRIAVPNNDSDKAAREWSAGRQFDAARLRTLKTIAARELVSDYQNHPHVYYLWKTEGIDVDMHALRQLASFLHTFGWGIDMAYADSFLLNETEKKSLTVMPGYSHYVPARTGQLRNVPSPGYLQDLTEAYHRYCERSQNESIDPSPRATKYGQERYGRVGNTELPIAKFVLRRLENSSAPHSVPWALAMRVAAWLRHAAAEALRHEGYSDDLVNSYVLGHGNGHREHMSFVPVPNIGTIYPDGAIRRVMVLEPAEGNGELAELLQLKLSSAVLHRLVENGEGARKTAPACSLLAAPQDSVWAYYLRPGRLWHSVTPVVLHGHNTLRGKFSARKTEELLYQAFHKSGYSREFIEELQFQPAPLWAGTEGALAMRVPQHLSKWPRYHVTIRFRQPVIGPVLAGLGKHYGIGLFAAAPESRPS